MDHLVAADVLIGEQAALPTVPLGAPQHVAPNVFYLCSRLVDKLWAGVFEKDPEEIFQFVLNLISQAKRRTGGVTGGLSLEGIYRSLNRVILYMLSRPHAGVASQMETLEALHKLTTNRAIVFGAGNHELEFFACLTFCLLRIADGKRVPSASDGQSRSIWHVRPGEDEEGEGGDGDLEPGEEATAHQGQHLLRNAAKRVWEELFVCKKPALEEAFKTSFGQSNSTPALDAARDLVLEAARRHWSAYLEAERTEAFYRAPGEFHAQLESRIQRITGGFAGGLKRLTSVTSVAAASVTGGGAGVGAGGGTGSGSGGSGSAGGKQKKGDEASMKVILSSLSRSAVEQATLGHVAIVRDVVEQHYRNRWQTDAHLLKYVEEEWLQTEARLTQERGLWGPEKESELTKWTLDPSEGPARMRKRFLRNDLFYLHYPYREELEREQEGKPYKYKRPTSRDSALWYRR